MYTTSNVGEDHLQLWIILLLTLFQVQELQAYVTTLEFLKNGILFYFQGWLVILAKKVKISISPLEVAHTMRLEPGFVVFFSPFEKVSSPDWSPAYKDPPAPGSQVLELTHLKLHVKKA